MRLGFTPLAEQDLVSIADYIATDNPRRAASFVRELRQQCERIKRNPTGYRLRPELGEGIRSCAHGRYMVFYRIGQRDRRRAHSAWRARFASAVRSG
ncbi:type II toxin-antitoxin system RelE/ParE family toxin [Ottowia beijingensis]|uniref:type II toxin-antitoxin system RelE/ParE family toxin n=1 Tax=Ottowia beijingensis TaxID=1207057 RepID=UPI00214DAF4C|nr:type II toxin-antitoxin system RelE/ParE family toxin [Ottowia beijingensis]